MLSPAFGYFWTELEAQSDGVDAPGVSTHEAVTHNPHSTEINPRFPPCQISRRWMTSILQPQTFNRAAVRLKRSIRYFGRRTDLRCGRLQRRQCADSVLCKVTWTAQTRHSCALRFPQCGVKSGCPRPPTRQCSRTAVFSPSDDTAKFYHPFLSIEFSDMPKRRARALGG